MGLYKNQQRVVKAATRLYVAMKSEMRLAQPKGRLEIALKAWTKEKAEGQLWVNMQDATLALVEAAKLVVNEED